MVAGKVRFLSETPNTEPLAERLKRSTPFYLITSVVLDQLERSKTTDPSLWAE